MSLKVSAIGTGRWGKILLSKFHTLSGLDRVYGHQNRETLEREFGFQFTEDVGELIETCDAVVIATPPASHYALAKQALSAGKDVFVEKPMALTSSEAEELAELAEAKGRILMVGHTLCYSTACQKFQELPGEPLSASAKFLKTSTTEKLLNAYWNFGIHMVALAVALGVDLERFEIEACDTAEENCRLFSLTKRTADGKEHALTWDFLAPENQEDMLMTECEHFLACVRERKTPFTNGRHGVAVIQAMERICPEYRK